MKSFRLLFLVLAALTAGCRTTQPVSPEFLHDVTGGPTPWTSTTFELEEEDFTFAIISDLNGGERPGIYATAVAQLNRLDPTFVLSVGDLIDGGTEDSVQMAKEWDSFDARTARLNMPFFYLGGNHDLTNPTMRAFWKARFGPRYYHFVYENVLFLMLDSEDFEEKRMWEVYHARAKALQILAGTLPGNYADSEYNNMMERKVGAMSQAQRQYYREVLAQHLDVRWTFVLMHKPLWQREDEQGLGELEQLLADRPYTVINGHLHTFSHRKRNDRDYLILGTTGGGQNPADSMAFDHVTLVRMAETPVITHLKMAGILDETGQVPNAVKEQ